MDAHPLAPAPSEPFSWANSRHRAEWQFVRDPRCAGGARSQFHEQADEWGIVPDSADTAALLLSELVTNAYRHGAADARSAASDWITVRCFLAFGLLRIEVSDSASELPCPRDASADDVSGRGLALVTALADRCGAYPEPPGKTVWCELAVALHVTCDSAAPRR